MQFRYKLQYQLVKLLSCSNKEAKALILAGEIKVNDVVIKENEFINPEDKIEVDNKCIRDRKLYSYYAFNKPRGIETTMNPEIANGLHSVLKLEKDFYHIGRLDKESEGLLILSNDGTLGKKLLNKLNKVEKEYLVEVEESITDEFLNFISGGVTIMGKNTVPCTVEKINSIAFKIILIEGINRQIRRMCYKAGYSVKKLVRIKFAGISNVPKTGEIRVLDSTEIAQLLSY